MLCADLQGAVNTINAGGVVAYPTEGVYGLGCDPGNTDAIKKILMLKKRSADRGLILIASHFSQLTPYCETLDEPTWKRVGPTWPGPSTWLLKAKNNISTLLTGGRTTIAVRVTAHPIAAMLCRACRRALVSTSANISNHRAARTLSEVIEVFGTQEVYALAGAIGGRSNATPIYDARNGNVVRGA